MFTLWKKQRLRIKGNIVTSVIVVKRWTKKDIPLQRLPFPWIGIEFYKFIKVVNAKVPIPPFLLLLLIFP